MRKCVVFIVLVVFVTAFNYSFRYKEAATSYQHFYTSKLNEFEKAQNDLLANIQQGDFKSPRGRKQLHSQINQARLSLKSTDFWLRYLEPIAYKKINGPLPVEWETEVFEKFEAPYKREGAGLTLAALYLEEPVVIKDSLINLVQTSLGALQTFKADSITSALQSYHHFFLCNRLFLLNLASIYTTGFECPDTTRIIPELRRMLQDIVPLYKAYNESFPSYPLSTAYLDLFGKTIAFVQNQPAHYSRYNHFAFVSKYVNPLFKLNQAFIAAYKVSSKSFNDYSLNKKATSIFDKELYRGQNTKGIFLRVNDTVALSEIREIGRLLFYDPILSVNNKRSCNSCHKSHQYFTDNSGKTALQLNGKDRLTRNAPSLLNVQYNHLLMLDGKHISMQNQLVDVSTNAIELGSQPAEIIAKVLTVKKYRDAFTKLLQHTPEEPEITIEHIASAITLYYSSFDGYNTSFDRAVNANKHVPLNVKQGFNLFMSKSQCATCHFVPHFNGVKPPYVGSEFEVLGVPADVNYKSLSNDVGRYNINKAVETKNAFRTGSLRNIHFTGPYMHNGIFSTLEQVIAFYDEGGGAGHGLKVPNQTLSSDPLRLSNKEKKLLITFMKSLSENIKFEAPPLSLPLSDRKELNNRKVGGEY